MNTATRPDLPERRTQLEQATDLAVDAFARCLHEVLPRVEAELYAAAERERDRTRQVRLLDAQQLVRRHRESLENAFRRAFAEIVRSRVTPGERPPTRPTATTPLLGLSLVNDADVEAEVVVRRLVERMRNPRDEKSAETLSALDERVGYLLGREHLKDDESPLSPEALVRAIQRCCEILDTENAIRVEILKSFEQVVAPGFVAGFEAVNTGFVQRQVLPDLAAWRRARAESRQGQHDGAYASSATQPLGRHPAATQPFGARTAAHPAAAPVSTQPGLGRSARNGMLAGNLNTGSSTGAQIDTRGGTGRHDVLPQDLHGHYSPAASLIDSFTLWRARQPVRRGQGEPTPDTVWPAGHRAVLDALPSLIPATPAVAAAMSGVVNAPLSDLNLLHQVRDNARRVGVPTDEEILIDLVALLIDKLLADAVMPERTRRLIARLQVPLLRAALLDRAFFARPEHPARRLLDAIGRAAVGREQPGEGDARFYEMLFDVVTTVETRFIDDLGVFEQEIGVIDAFLADEAERTALRYARATELLRQIERRQAADAQVEAQIDEAMTGTTLPDPVRGFITGPWRQVLVEAAVSGASDDTRAALRDVISDLGWSVLPKSDPADRQRLVQLLPGLLKRIKSGLLTISWPGEEQNRFFAGLMQLHSTAVRLSAPRADAFDNERFERLAAQVRALRIDTDSTDQPPPPIAPALVRASAEESRLPLTVPEPWAHNRTLNVVPLPAEEADGWLVQLRRGDWIERLDGSKPALLQLRWISPLRSLWLFTDRAAQNATSFTPELLREQLMLRLIRVVTDAHDLSGRVLRSVEATISD
ncbi:DUF1631 family protein [Derxia gummosa]|uniref:DUF1631 family protein n=1 Tax=Derxia gummosa DSM 723 TaxID=1121388 RepID=A0A8B6X271_9BURK|nr:DUF1631 family protein [Derxia gummosa]